MPVPIHLIIPDTALCEAVAEQLRLAQFAVSVNATPSADAAAVIVDQAGYKPALLQKLRADNDRLCILLLGDEAEDSESVITESFPKPLRLGHLLMRLRYHLETAPRLRNAAFILGPYRFDPQNRKLTVIDSGTVIRLTEKETGLLELIGHSDAPVPREELLASLWGYDGRIDTHTLETHIYQLRRKLDGDPRGAGLLVNEQGAYRLITGESKT